VPFDAENFVGILSQQLYQEPVPPRLAAPDANIPAAFEAIILKCMAKKPERRYQSMNQLRDDLLQLDAKVGGSMLRQNADAAHRAGRDAVDVGASVEGTALSTELTLAGLRPRRWTMYAAIAAPVAIVGGVLVAQFGGAGSVPQAVTATPTAIDARARGGGATAAAPIAPSVAPILPPASSAPAESPPARVLLGVSPATAHVFMAGQDLGESPVSIDVQPGAKATVEVRHPDYETQQLQLDGSEPKLSIQLVSKNDKKKKGRRRAKRSLDSRAGVPPDDRAPAPRTPAEDKIGGQLFVEPWQKP
jgi:serine/threonine-protein kinase